jgi:curli biogenesis system outer membrane secretion channel CsgG
MIRFVSRPGVLVVPALFLAACATTQMDVNELESMNAGRAEQQQAQQQIVEATPVAPSLKQKIAVGRFSNETLYGRTFFRDADYDPLGKQAADMLITRLIDTNRFMVFERSDLSKLEREQAIQGEANLVGVDTLILGSVTEFGRKTTGQTGFLSGTKLQTARAVVELRLVDSKTGYSFFSADGTGEASLESGDIAGFGSKAEYDATLNDKAISAAISDVIEELLNELDKRPWTTDILNVEDSLVYLSGGERQGLAQGDKLRVMQRGKTVRSQQTGFDIELPATEIAQLQVQSFFGDSEINEGSIASLTSGSLPAELKNVYVAELEK